MSGIRVYRVQDAKGRGPFRPGMSVRWAGSGFNDELRPHKIWPEEFGDDLIDRLGRPGEWFGSGVVDVQTIREWFSDSEYGRMKKLGYRLVCLKVDRILAESPAQVVFARKRPFARGALIVPWPQKVTPAP